MSALHPIVVAFVDMLGDLHLFFGKHLLCKEGAKLNVLNACVDCVRDSGLHVVFTNKDKSGTVLVVLELFVKFLSMLERVMPAEDSRLGLRIEGDTRRVATLTHVRYLCSLLVHNRRVGSVGLYLCGSTLSPID